MVKVEWIKLDTLKIGPKTIASIVGFLLTFASIVGGCVMIYDGLKHEIGDAKHTISTVKKYQRISQKKNDRTFEKIDEKITTLVNNDTKRTVTDENTAQAMEDLKNQNQSIINLLMQQKLAAEKVRETTPQIVNY